MIAERFERDYGCTEAEWLRCLPGAVGVHSLSLKGSAQALVTLGNGQLQMHWTVLAPRRIAMVSLPRVSVGFAFEGVDAVARETFMRYFDLYTQRGGG